MASFFVADRASLAPLLGEGAINTIERPELEFYSLRDFEAPGAAIKVENLELLLRARSALGAKLVLGAPTQALVGRSIPRRLM